MLCAKCNKDNPTDASFCEECGAKLELICPACKASLSPGARFCKKCGTAIGPAKADASTTVSSTKAQIRVAADGGASEAIEGERKTVTALFADIKGSTALEEGLDPEEARAIVDPALKLMIDAVRHYDGHVVQSTGDGIFALFGAPVAHEDHPQRALYAAIRMQEDVRRYADKLRAEGRSPLQIRIGADTGEVVMRTIETGGKTEYSPIGHAANLASRMQSLANPGSTVIAESTRKLVEGYFALKSLGASRVKGISEPVNVYEVTGLGPLRTRLQRSAVRGYTKFVGRQREMDALKSAAEQAKAGSGQIVAAMAEPGVGKSRLFFEFKVTTQSGWMVLEAFSVSHGKASAFLPVIDLLWGYFKITSDDDERTRREKINGKVLTLDRSLEDVLPYLHALLGLSDENGPLAEMEPQTRKRRSLEAIKRILLRESLNQPLMVIFEDLHWIDDETQALLGLLADSIGTAKILLLVNYRPEYSHQWHSKTYYTQLRLDPLGKESADEMLSALLGDGTDIQALKRLIIERTEGNPFFMEETVQVLLEEGALKRNGAMELAKPLNELRIPPTVQAILASRIDRLPPAEKNLLQTLSAIGKEFPLGLVSAVASSSADELSQMLDNLQLGEFIYEQPAVGDVEYTFKHALTQEVAYGALLMERRKLLHEQIGVAIETVYRGQLDLHLNELAHHYSLSADAHKAVEYLHLAGEQAARRSAHSEAISKFETALNLIKTLPATPDRDRRELGLQIAVSSAISAAKGMGALERESSLLRARDLSQSLGEDAQLFPVLWHLFHFHAQRGDLRTARECAQQSLAVAERQRDPVMIASARTALGLCHFYTGEFADARRHFEFPLTPHDPWPNHWYLTDRGFEVLAGVLDALAAGLLGYADQCLGRLTEVVEHARAESRAHDLAFALVGGGRGFLLAGRPSAAQSSSEEAIALSRIHRLEERAALGMCIRGIALAEQGQLEEGIACLRQGISAYTASGGRLAQSEFISALAIACGKAGRPGEGLEAVDSALAIGRDGGESYYQGELYRIRAELILIESVRKTSEAEQLFRTAIDTARGQQARTLELRATMSLARLLDKQGKRDEARAVLAEIYNWFTEGFDTADLKDAKALLEVLNA